MTTARRRLDQRMVDQGLAPSRARAQAMIRAGAVLIAGVPATRAASTAEGSITVDADPCPWVSRAALKLDHALDHFALAPHGVAADIGASTGGFTQVLLARGASRVYAVDVGRDQLHPSLLDDPRVVDLSATNARTLNGDVLPPLEWIVSDVSFISLGKALGPVLSLARPGAMMVALIKPQFEAGPGRVGKGGIVRDPAIHTEARNGVRHLLTDAGWSVLGETESPITGADGNREFLIAARRSGAPRPGDHLTV